VNNNTKLNKAINKAVINYLSAEYPELSSEIVYLLTKASSWDYQSHFSDNLLIMRQQAEQISKATRG
jgi:hypothetical protein